MIAPAKTERKTVRCAVYTRKSVTEGLEQGFSSRQLATHDPLAPLIEKQIAHYRSLYGTPQLDSVEKIIDDIHQRHQTAMGKVKIVHPPSPQISLTYD